MLCTTGCYPEEFPGLKRNLFISKEQCCRKWAWQYFSQSFKWSRIYKSDNYRAERVVITNHLPHWQTHLVKEQVRIELYFGKPELRIKPPKLFMVRADRDIKVCVCRSRSANCCFVCRMYLYCMFLRPRGIPYTGLIANWRLFALVTGRLKSLNAKICAWLIRTMFLHSHIVQVRYTRGPILTLTIDNCWEISVVHWVIIYWLTLCSSMTPIPQVSHFSKHPTLRHLNGDQENW